jgi:hypothetical protein
MPLKSPMVDSISTYGIPIVSHLKYLGVDTFPSLDKTIAWNIIRTLKSIQSNLSRFGINIPNSLTGRISIVKTIILPRLNRCSSMLLMSSNSGYWDNIYSGVSKCTLPFKCLGSLRNVLVFHENIYEMSFKMNREYIQNVNKVINNAF